YGSFEAEFRNFWTNGSYYCILAGLGFVPDQPLPLLMHKTNSVRKAEELFTRVKQQQRELLQTLPSNFDYLQRPHRKSDVGAQRPNGPATVNWHHHVQPTVHQS